VVYKDAGIIEELSEARRIRVEEEKKLADEAEQLNRLIRSKLDEFKQFLIGLENDNEVKKLADKVSELLVPDDMKRTYERLCQYVDSVIKRQ
jgi:hypothetical protein